MQRVFAKQEKLIILALAAVFSMPASAATINVDVYGKIDVDYESARNNKATLATTANSVNRVQSNASRFGVKGIQPLGEGLDAVWQLEAQFDSAGNGGAAPFNGSRNSNIGLKGNFGTVFFGNWDTPYKVARNKLELYDNTTMFTATSMIGRTGTTTGAVNYNTRQASVLQYWSPNMNGFQGKISYSPDSAETTTANKTKLSLSGTYENALLYGALAYERRPDQTTASMTDTANRLIGAYKFGSGLVGMSYERLSVGTAAAKTESQSNWELSANYKSGSSNIGAFYIKNGNLGARANTGAHMYSFRYGYKLFKDTELYGAYAKLNNDIGANYSTLGTTAATVGAVSAATVGSSQSGFGVGLIHAF